MSISTTICKSTMLVTATLFASMLGTNTANAASLHHIDELAVRLEGQTKQLAGDFRFHYFHAGQFRHEFLDAMKMARLAGHIHDVVHHHGGLLHVQHDLNKLDGLFHHMEELVAYSGGHGHGHGHIGHIHGHTCRIHELVKAIGGTLHHLKDDVRLMTTPHHGHHPAPAPVPAIPGIGIGGPGHGGHGHGGHGHVDHGRHGGGISFGNGRFAIRFGF